MIIMIYIFFEITSDWVLRVQTYRKENCNIDKDVLIQLVVAKKAEVKVTDSKESKKQVKEEEAEEEEEEDDDEEDEEEDDEDDEDDEDEEESEDESDEESESEDEDLTPIERARARIWVITFCHIINLFIILAF